MKEFGIYLFGHTRPLFLVDVLKSLEMQSALSYVEVWLDGHQGEPDKKRMTELAHHTVQQFDVAEIRFHRGALSFRKLILQALCEAVEKYDRFLILEDDCFPTRHAVETFQNELATIATNPQIFSVYGHHFLVPEERDTITRFQGWGWGTTSEKLKPFLSMLLDCYSLTEERYLDYVDSVLTDEIRAVLDVTPPRLPSATLTQFFAWDETLALLTALEGKLHKKTPVRTIYNFGASADSSRFKNIESYTKPPFNMVPHAKIWDYF